MDTTTAVNNALVLQKYQDMCISKENAQAVKTGALCLGVKGDRLVIVENKFSFITRLVNFFKRISTSQEKINAVSLETIQNKALLRIIDKVSLMVPGTEAGKLEGYKTFANKIGDEGEKIKGKLEAKEKELSQVSAEKNDVAQKYADVMAKIEAHNNACYNPLSKVAL
jgi:hypothetical protein